MTSLRSKIGRVCWLAISTLFLALGLLMAVQAMLGFNRDRVRVVTEYADFQSQALEGGLRFPAVTVCAVQFYDRWNLARILLNKVDPFGAGMRPFSALFNKLVSRSWVDNSALRELTKIERETLQTLLPYTILQSPEDFLVFFERYSPLLMGTSGKTYATNLMLGQQIVRPSGEPQLFEVTALQYTDMRSVMVTIFGPRHSHTQRGTHGIAQYS